MKTIKTRNTVKNVKVLDKSINLSKRMKDSFIRTKDKAEETQSASHDTPTDYASDNIQVTVRGAAEETAQHLPIPRMLGRAGCGAPDQPRRVNNVRHKASENWNRAKGHFQEVKRQMPKECQQVAAQAQKTAQTTKTNAIKLKSEADHAFNRASEAKSAVKDAKLALKQVKQTGQQAIRDIKVDTRQNMKIMRSSTTSSKPIQSPMNMTARNADFLRPVSVKKPTDGVSRLSRPVSDTPNTAPKNGKLIHQQKNAIKMRNDTKQISKPASSKVPDANPVKMVNKSTSINPSEPIKDSVSRPSYTKVTPKSADKAANTLHKSADTVKSTKKSVKNTAKGTVKTMKKSVKTAEKTAKKEVKTAQQTAKTAHRTARAAVKTAENAERAARVATKVAVKTAKIAVKAITAFVKASIAAIKGLVAAIAAGGWIAVLIILIICMIGLFVGSIYGIFFSSELSEGGKTINTVITEINAEYTVEIDKITGTNTYDLIDMSGARASWKQVLAVYTVKTVANSDNPMEVTSIDDEKAVILKSIFWEMNNISYTLDTVEIKEDVLDDDGLPTGETVTVTKSVLCIIVTHKTPDEMALQYSFTDEQKEWLAELLKPDYNNLWNSLLYGISTVGNGSMIGIADTQIGNVGGEPYWSWYGFPSRVEWCATFVSWVAEQCGFINADIIPRFSGCMNGVQWFKNKGQWQDNTYTPRPGDIIFFDWDSDGTSDHVGIVESITSGIVNTIEGNTSDRVARRSYELDNVKIYGYGVPIY